MKKLMVATGYTARIHIGIAYASKRDQNRKWRFTCKTIAYPPAQSVPQRFSSGALSPLGIVLEIRNVDKRQ
jgi:hypothetical protein